MESFTCRFSNSEGGMMYFKHTMELVKKIRGYLIGQSFHDKPDINYLLDVVKFSPDKCDKQVYFNFDELLTFGIDGILDIMAAKPTIVMPAFSKSEEKELKGKYGFGLELFMHSNEAEARICPVTYTLDNRTSNPYLTLLFGLYTVDNALGERLFEEIPKVLKGNAKLKEWWADSNNWNSSMFTKNLKSFKIKETASNNVPLEKFSIETFKPFFESVGRAAREKLVDKVYDCIEKGDPIRQYLQENHPQLVIDVGRDRLLREE